MEEKISIYIQAHRSTTVNVNIHIPTDRVDVECKQEIMANREIKNHKEIDLGYETEDIEKKWCDTDDEGRIYDNLD